MHENHRIELTLRPSESIEWRFGQGQKFHYAPNPVIFELDSADLHRWGANAWATMRNGKWTYTPRVDGPWKIRAPYVMVGSRTQAPPGSAFSASYDGREWTRIPSGDLASMFPSPGAPHYEYILRRDSGGGPVTIENDLQMAPLSMPELALGTNRIQYSDQSPGVRSVTITLYGLSAAPRNRRPRRLAPPTSSGPHRECRRVPLRVERRAVPPLALIPGLHHRAARARAWKPLTPGLLNPGQT